MRDVDNFMPVRVVTPTGTPLIRQCYVVRPRLSGGRVIADTVIENRPTLVVLDEYQGVYLPCDENLETVRFVVKKKTRLNTQKGRTLAGS